MFATFDFDSFLCLKKTYKPQIRLFPPKYNAKKLQYRNYISQHLFDYIYNVDWETAYWWWARILRVTGVHGPLWLSLVSGKNYYFLEHQLKSSSMYIYEISKKLQKTSIKTKLVPFPTLL